MNDAAEQEMASILRVAVMRLRRRLANERDPDNDLSTRTMEVLGLLFREGPTTVGALAVFEQVQPPSMTRTIDHLQERGFVTRAQCATDKRQTMVTITEAGAQILRDGRDRRNAWLAQRLAELTPAEREVLAQAAPLLGRLAADPPPQLIGQTEMSTTDTP